MVDTAAGVLGDNLGAALAARAALTPVAAAHFPCTGVTLTLAALEARSARLARALLAAGAGPGAVVGLLTGNRDSFLVGLFGALRAGAAVTVLPPPMAATAADAHVETLGRIAAVTDMRLVVVDPALSEVGAALCGRHPGLLPIDPHAGVPGGAGLPAVDPDAPAVLQFTSGSTGSPRGVQLSHRSVLAGLRAIVASAALTPADAIVQWVPTYHDMGLFGMLAVLLNGGDAHVFEPWTFLRHPDRFLRYVAEHGGTLTTSPNFGYDLILDSFAARPQTLDLSRWRLAFNGAEPVLAGTVRRFGRQLAPTGVAPSTMYPVYGMAEVTLAIAFPRPGTTPRAVCVDSAALGADGAVTEVDPDSPHAKSLVSVGRPVAGLSVRIVDPDGAVRPERRLGEIQVSGPSVMSGYFRDEAATRAAFDGPWLRTGDLGFQLDGELFVAGRRREMIVVHGHNHFPEDAEAVARRVPGVHRRRCVAVADPTPGDERLVVIAETRLPAEAHAGLREEIRVGLVRELGLAAVDVHLVGPQWITRTTSGKWQRLAAARRLAGTG